MGNSERPIISNIVVLVFAYLPILAIWIIVGGLITQAPRISHNIEQRVPTVLFDATEFLWIAFPIALAVVFVMNNRISKLFAGGIFILWLVAVGIMWSLVPR